MKIRKLNEAFEEKWTNENITEIFQKYYEFCGLIGQYINFKLKKNVEVQDVWWELTEKDYFCVHYTLLDFATDKNIYFSKKEYFDDILPFINDPDLYTTSKTYNL